MKKLLGIAAVAWVPVLGWACACGCGMFDVRTRSMFPAGEGGLAFVEYNYADQNHNWSGQSRAPAADNSDKDIRTEFYTAGAQYMFDREWGIIAQVPYWNRTFTTVDELGHSVSFTHGALGDARIRGIYSGFSPDMSSGCTFGLKLPTGDYTYRHFDRDTEIGTGSTDILLGAYRMGMLPIGSRWYGFINGQLDLPALTADGYDPGSEIGAVAGVYYNGWRAGHAKIAPVAQAIATHRWCDHGAAGDPENTGYDRVLLSPGVEVDRGNASLYADVAFPVYQDVKGNQLAASALLTFRMSFSF